MLAIKRLDRKIHRRALINISDDDITQQLIINVRIDEMIVLLLKPVIVGDEDVVITKESYGDQRFHEPRHRLRLLINIAIL